jgi:hypothetical protein
MKSSFRTIIALLFIAIIGIIANTFAQSPPLSVDFPAVAVSTNTATAQDAIILQADEIGKLQYEIDTYQIKTQSDRLDYYGLQRKLSQAKQTYYNLLATVTPVSEQAAGFRQTAWQFKKQSDQFAQRQYAAIPFEKQVPTLLGRLHYDQ